MVGAGCLQTCGETKIVERELEGQITGDFFFFFFLLVCLDSVTFPGTDPKPLEVRWEAQTLVVGKCLLLPWKPTASVGFESAPECVFQMTVIFRVTP